MTNIISLISGKGGSGKTTLALSMASFLSQCGVRVLLIDCDMSTNGATYFFEDKLRDNQDDSIISLAEIMYGESSFYAKSGNENMGHIRAVHINEMWDFIPSIIRINEDYNEEMFVANETAKDCFSHFLIAAETKYDVIINDCQAGYSETLQMVLRYSDACLAVMEADAISSSAMRTLFLKIGSMLRHKKVYQVFNKATTEEYDIYSKISGGTVFTNIETIRFDWKIRKAFAVAQIPDMERTSVDYGESIYNICKILFKSDIIQEKISQFDLFIRMNHLSEQKNQIQQKIVLLDEKNKNKNSKIVDTKKWILFIIVPCLLLLVSFIALKEEVFYKNDESFLISIGITVISLYISLFMSFWERNRNRRSENEMRSHYIDELMSIKEEYNTISRQVKRE